MPHPDEDMLSGCLNAILGYFALLGLCLLVAWALILLGLNYAAATCYAVAGLYLWAASLRPRWVFDVVRSIRWFSFIRSELAMRWVLLLMAIGMAAVGTWFMMSPPDDLERAVMARPPSQAAMTTPPRPPDSEPGAANARLGLTGAGAPSTLRGRVAAS